VIGAAIAPAVVSTLSAVVSVAAAAISRLFTVGAGRVVVLPLTVTARSEPAALTPIDWLDGVAAIGGGATAHGARNASAMGSLVFVSVTPPVVTGVDAETLTRP